MTCSRNEQGQALPLFALCVVTLLVAAALSVDIGSLAATNRRLQGVADLAAIDGSRELTGTTCSDTYVLPTDASSTATSQYDHVARAAVASAGRNGFVMGGNKNMTIELGLVTRDLTGVPAFTALPNLCAQVPDSVRVRVGDRTGFSFASVIGQSGRISARAGVGTLEGLATFTLGSALATVDTSRSNLLNPILSQTICRLQPGGCNLTLTAAGYQGLIDSRITYGALATQLGFLTTSELLNANLTIDQILSAATLLADPTTTAGANAQTALSSLSTAVTATTTLKLLNLVTGDLANGNEAASAELNLFQLVMGTAAIANGTNAVSIPNTAVTIPYVSSITASVSLIEAPITIGNKAGAPGTTRQFSVTINPVINLNTANLPGLSLAGLNLGSVTGSLPTTISAGRATGTLTRVRCGADKGIDTTVAVEAAALAGSGSLNVGLSTSSNVPLLQGLVGPLGTVTGGNPITTTLTASGTGASTTVGTTPVSFTYPTGFGPSGSQHVGNTTVGLNNLVYGAASLSMSVPLVNVLGVSLSTTVSLAVSPSAIVALLAPVLTAIDNGLVKPLMDALGLDLGAADLTAQSIQCGVPTLAGS